MRLVKIIAFIGIIFWPLSYLLANGLNLPNLPKTIFVKDHNARQEVIRLGQQYPNVTLARTFQNKYKIYVDKYKNNFFFLIDPNNYFFESAPRQGGVVSQNLNKFPFISMFFFGYAILNYKKVKRVKQIGISFVALVFLLSFFDVFDKWDFLLWFPLAYLFSDGVKLFFKENKRWIIVVSIIYFTFTIPELIRLFI